MHTKSNCSFYSKRDINRENESYQLNFKNTFTPN